VQRTLIPYNDQTGSISAARLIYCTYSNCISICRKLSFSRSLALITQLFILTGRVKKRPLQLNWSGGYKLMKVPVSIWFD